jgi:transposase-like protein
MSNENKQKAKDLYLNTSLNKTQIAEVLGISRRTVHFWIRQDSWDRLKAAATHLPSMIVEECYYLMGQLTRSMLGQQRAHDPVTKNEVETMYKLTLCIQKLKNRSTTNESMEMFAFFQDGLKRKDPELADALMPHISKYLSARANTFMSDFMPPNFNAKGYLEQEEPDLRETQEDFGDLLAWEQEAEEERYNAAIREKGQQVGESEQ